MKEKVNKLFKDKLILVMLVLGLLTIVAAAGAVKIRKGSRNVEESPYLEMKEPEHLADAGLSETPVAGNSNAQPVEEQADELAEAGDLSSGNEKEAGEMTAAAENSVLEETQPDLAEAGAAAEEALVLDFSETEKLAWPVAGNVILSYCMDTTTYFPTLEQYQVNPANIIQSEVSTPVAAPADARVLEIGSNEEIGNYVCLDMGNGYTAVCGQLKEIPLAVNEYLHRGDLVGYVAEPTKYYSVEGSNLYFELRHGDTPVDALDYLE